MGEVAAPISLEEYLSTSYRPDLEFIDGVVKEKPVASPAQGRTQMMLGWWFGMHEAEWSIRVFAESRTQVSVTKVRLPDASVLPAGPVPRKVITRAALIAIEVLSDSDTYRELKERARDFEGMGVKNIWLRYPVTRTDENMDARRLAILRRGKATSPRLSHLSGSPMALETSRS